MRQQTVHYTLTLACTLHRYPTCSFTHSFKHTHTHTQWHKERLDAADAIIYVIKEMLKEVSLKFLENSDSLSSWELAADQFPLHIGMLTMKLKPGEVRMAYQ